MAYHLPWDVMVLILIRSPSKSLIRFQSVCKSWLSFISSTQFRLLQSRNNFSRSLVRRVSWTGNKDTYSIHFNDQHLTVDTSVSIELPFNLHRGEIVNLKPIGSCNGVICLFESKRDETILWNPCIRRSLTLNPPIHRYYAREPFIRGFNHSQNWYLVFGFGYDKMTDDYKVVRLAYIKGPSMTIPHVEVYSMKAASWRIVEFPHHLPYYVYPYIEMPVFFNGSAHWIAHSTPRSSNASILTFDMSTERFGEIQLPENFAQDYGLKLGPVVVEESLGVICSKYPLWSIPGTYEIWVMKEYKNPASWTMPYNKHYLDKNAGIAFGVTNNGGLIAVSGGHLVIYNQDGCHNVFGSGSEVISESIFVGRYEESLGLLDVGDDVGLIFTTSGPVRVK